MSRPVVALAGAVPGTGGAWWREFVAGAAGGLAVLAPVLTLGLLAYAALGPAAAAVGIPAALVATVLGSSVFAWLARGPMPASGPSSAPVLMLAGLVAVVVADPAFRGTRPQDVAALLALCALAVVAMGLLQIAFALGGMVRAARFVPQPVLAGFMNGVALVFMSSQLPTLLGWPEGAWTAEGWRAVGATEPATLAVGAITVVAIGLAPRVGRWLAFARLLPATVVGLLVGSAAYATVATLWPHAPLGALTGRVPPLVPWPDKLAPLRGLFEGPVDAAQTAALLHRHLGAALGTALLMALIGTLDIVLNGLALDQALRTRTDPRRELLALGLANIVSGVFGGLPLLLLRVRALATHRAGGRGRASLVCGNVLFAVLATVGGPLIAVLPKVVLAALMVTIAVLLFDGWSLRLARQWLRGQRSAEARLNLSLVAVVALTSVVLGFATGVATGALLAVALFVHSMNRSLLRSRYSAARRPSRRIYPKATEAALEHLRRHIAVLELEGALFFGSADRLAREVDAFVSAAAAATAPRAVVMDFRRIGLIDASGAVVLSQIGQRLGERGIGLLLAGVSPQSRHGRALSDFAGTALPATAWYPDLDRAVEAAERQALQRAGQMPLDATMALVDTGLMAGLDGAERALLAAAMERRSLAAGERLFTQGDSADRLFVLTRGSISVLGGTDAAPGTRQRIVSGSVGMMLGELAMLDGHGRSADAVADTAAEVHALSQAALQRLATEHPALAVGVYRNIALHLSQRLRLASIVDDDPDVAARHAS